MTTPESPEAQAARAGAEIELTAEDELGGEHHTGRSATHSGEQDPDGVTLTTDPEAQDPDSLVVPDSD